MHDQDDGRAAGARRMATGGQVPAVPIGESVARDYLICLEDGRRMKMLQRHLRVHHGLSPAQYRAKWGLPPDYPMVAPGYAAAKRAVAVRMWVPFPMRPTEGDG
ncbi:MucR family transcriptional regulator [Falsiroseomonas sp.]|uniref:MucR family transcriptional regulator n=1 Tax=Falsiroseomonas sp. TaxID=2870721 RepID=UPI003565A2AE